ncbi:DNA sulfur modification protein DndB [Methylomonas methanica]|uniref:DGQHR domain-containing protein n=1 Tax=Methylomonas methanica TaxID=421 RepID=A0A177MLC9_METMH|nr:DNA sulfur modification protein DndB [Methylomonas methanica]OAI06195.1 hypothetical protein A1332_01430 [Methylomonas methanica]
MKTNKMNNFYPALRGVMGSWIYYPILMNPEDIVNNVQSSKEIRESKSLDDYLQRELTSNVKKIFNYISTCDDRFFNSIILGVFENTPEWFSLNMKGIDEFDDSTRDYLEDSMGILKLTGKERLFAIDGQHRVEAIKRYYASNQYYNDQISVILVLHVDNDPGKRRTRKLFSDINKKAQAVSPGELAIIDEEDIENIVARRFFSNYNRIPSNSISLSKTAPITKKHNNYFTNLLTIVSISKAIKKTKTKGFSYNEDTLYEHLTDFFDIIINSIPSIEKSLGNENITEKLRFQDNMAYMRPIGLEILAICYKRSLNSNKLSDFEAFLKTEDLSLKSEYFNGMIYQKGKIFTKNKTDSVNSILDKLNIKKE